MDTNQIQQIVDDAVAQVVALVRQSITEQVHASLSNGVSKPSTKRGRPAKVKVTASDSTKKPRKPLSEEAKQRLRDNLAKARKAKARKAREDAKAVGQTASRKKRQPTKSKQ